MLADTAPYSPRNMTLASAMVILERSKGSYILSPTGELDLPFCFLLSAKKVLTNAT